ncbi:related to N-glycosylase/DNA lyase [Saccharomycodes ludwigii]|uniref:DNA-(apurinic or apyrimidinic site) lyase n=1 Tax=Saccharomycodes ludwigii TaxID=36035 RepID=A0A376BD09_9ASCO|nr:hypothetical protein SCDLUD_004333 [Saccharomycodes ludwigii]KAH3900016.1 hypothetical protein SCDLUD_004333 [Saccharomycodes ludwigii]SSD62010.1 related to N-glycosylase/DNA lyase [Saccharomycodes ludwigii]
MTSGVDKWFKIAVNIKYLDISTVLQIGQSFRWVYNGETNEYISSINLDHDKTFDIVKLKQDDKFMYYTSVNNNNNKQLLHTWVRSYFLLDIDRKQLFEHWKIKDPKHFSNLSHIEPLCSSCCILQQDPWETLLSFICSSNNNISRITKMCHTLTELAGDEIPNCDQLSPLYTFPNSGQIIKVLTESILRENGFGYRAKYIIETAKKIVDLKLKDGMMELSDSQYLKWKISGSPYLEAREFALAFSGVGPKVADCFLLMGMGYHDVVPVDVHVNRIAQRDYKITSGSSNNKKTQIAKLKLEYTKYPTTRRKINFDLDLIRLFFRDLWGAYSGWAQAIFFAKEVGSTSGIVDGSVSKRKLLIKTEDDNSAVTKRIKVK